MDPIYLSTIRGGLNNEDPATDVGPTQVVLCENVDLDRSTLGGRRGGHDPITVTGVLTTKVPFLFRHLPNNEFADAQLWAVSTSGTSSVWAYKNTAWNVVTPTGLNALDVAEGEYHIRAASHAGKLFLAYPSVSGTDRLHVWDGTSIRPTGLSEANAPTVTTSGTGSFDTLRYYRVRETVQASGVTILRSEPSDPDDFTPPGNGEGATVTKGSTVNTNATHWEVEESLDNVNYYRIATVVIGTSTYVDELTPAEVTTTGVLSADIGDYSLQWSAKYLLVDEDRLMIAGSWEQPNLASRVGWSPVGLAPGVGNDERMEDDTDPFIDLDNQDGGEITDMAGPLFGYVYVFKYQKIYKLVRTKQRARAYEALPITSAFGALKNTVISGMDQNGRPCLYFLDPYNGPCRIGVNGIERCGYDILGTWRTVNLSATVVARSVYYMEKEQAWFYLATNDATFPDTKIVAHTRYMNAAPDGVRGGWALSTGTYMAALTAIQFSTNVDAGVARSQFLKPFIGTSISGALITMCDEGTDDNGTGFVARWKSRPLSPFNYGRKFGVRAGNYVGLPVVSGDVSVTLVRDFGLEEVQRTVTLDAVGSESPVIKPLDSLALVDAYAIQVEVGDSDESETDWATDALMLVTSPGEIL